ncbi:DNA cytosine methyltransferase [Mycolicibacterium mageritense]|uniref:DNA cytosine methyltransferase n=1 Tax=Mycolicibacterium mageritense TaxID=53462 RepID=UPI001E60D0E4|nr:DNA cytosine methyltransferase [Mycolicibacterium mageritense]MCC9182595.1 DNA cytosine methyltransferase [Mycolicibacterium mageritense]
MNVGLLTARHSAISDDAWDRSQLGLYVPKRIGKRRYTEPVGVDLFAGAGGFSCGFHQAGFHVAAASEIDFDAAMTYMVNLARPGVKIHFDTHDREAEWERRLAPIVTAKPKPGHEKTLTTRIPTAGSGWISGEPAHHRGCEHFFAYDVRELTGAAILDALGLDEGEVDVVFGGPPCQGFSKAGKRDVMDPRNSLIFEFARLICEIQPKTFVMENVTGLVTMRTPEGMPVLDAFSAAVAGGGYSDYEALRTALAGADGARAAVRGAKSIKRKADDSADDDAQDALFDVELSPQPK